MPEATAFQQDPVLDDASYITALSFASPSVRSSQPRSLKAFAGTQASPTHFLALQCSSGFARCLLRPPPALPVPRSLGVRAVHGVGCRWERGTVFAAQTSPSLSGMGCCWRLLQGCRPARLLLKGRRSPRHQLCTPFLLFFLSVLAALPAGGAGSVAGGSIEVSRGTPEAQVCPVRCWRLTAWQSPSSSLS